MALVRISAFAMFPVFQIFRISAFEDFAARFANCNGNKAEQSVFRSNIREQITTIEQERHRLPQTNPCCAEIDDELKGLKMLLGGSPLQASHSEKLEFSAAGTIWLDGGIEKTSLMLDELQSSGYRFSWLRILLLLL